MLRSAKDCFRLVIGYLAVLLLPIIVVIAVFPLSNGSKANKYYNGAVALIR